MTCTQRTPAFEPVRMTKDEFLALPEYNTTLPTGVVPGKRWRRHDGIFDADFLSGGRKPVWLVGEYGPAVDGKCPVNWYIPIFLPPGVNSVG